MQPIATRMSFQMYTCSSLDIHVGLRYAYPLPYITPFVLPNTRIIAAYIFVSMKAKLLNHAKTGAPTG